MDIFTLVDSFRQATEERATALAALRIASDDKAVVAALAAVVNGAERRQQTLAASIYALVARGGK